MDDILKQQALDEKKEKEELLKAETFNYDIKNNPNKLLTLDDVLQPKEEQPKKELTKFNTMSVLPSKMKEDQKLRLTNRLKRGKNRAKQIDEEKGKVKKSDAILERANMYEKKLFEDKK